MPFLLQLLVFLAAREKPYYALASLGTCLLTLIILLIVQYASHRRSPTRLAASANRQLWSARIDNLLGLIMLSLVSYLTTPIGTAWNPLNIYPLWVVLMGVTSFTLGSVIWGRLYELGLVLLATAALMAFLLEWSPLLLGLMMSAVIWSLRST